MSRRIDELVKRFEALVDTALLFDNRFNDLPNTPQVKMALVKRLIELSDMLGAQKVPDGAVRLDDVPFFEIDYAHPNQWRILSRLPGASNKPVDQHGMFFPLLMFLLVRSSDDFTKGRKNVTQEPVFDIITRYVDEIKSNLSLSDFVRTKTGAVRSFTNTRFAARRLRELGMLKYTRREAFKTWELSISGIIVASTLYEPGWRKKLNLADGWIYQNSLSKRISEILATLYSPDTFIEQLNWLYGQTKETEGSKISSNEMEKIRQLVKDHFSRMQVLMNKKKEAASQREEIINIIAELDKTPAINRLIKCFKSAYGLADFNCVMKSFFKAEDNKSS
jgi:hypothetical protein